MKIPNICHRDVPQGHSECAREVSQFGSDFKPCGKMSTAEGIANSWKCLRSTVDTCGDRSYAFIGNFTLLIF